MNRLALCCAFLGAVAWASLAAPAVANARAESVAGTVLSVSPPEPFSQTNPGGTVTNCEVYGVTLATSSGQIVTFAVGGVLSPDSTLDPRTQQLVQTLQTAAAEGTSAIATVNYDASDTLCGIPLRDFVTSDSLAPAPPPAPPPSPTPPSSGTPPPSVPPQVRTASGTVTQMSVPEIIFSTTQDCEAWEGALTTPSGQTIQFYLETRLAGSVETGLKPTDQNAIRTHNMLVQAQADGKRAVATITYVESEVACGLPLTNVVTRASVVVQRASRGKTKSGRVAKVSRPTVLKANGASCEIWKGTAKTRPGATFSFAIESGLRNGHPNQRAVNIVKTLKRARAEKRRATITYAGPIEACGKILPHVVTGAAI